MQKTIFLFLLIGLCLGSTTAQTYFGKRTVSAVDAVNITDTVRILAVLADFLEDRDASTFGNGKFGSIYTQDYGQTIIDPLPHDHSYFSNHLEFAKNYYRKVSGGKVTILYDILPEVITVNQTMRNYSPPQNTTSLNALGIFAKEVWQKADSAHPDINFSGYDLFTVFHAGVGRDISLPGSFGNERDLPSVYLSDKSLKNIFNSDLTGLPVNRFGQVNTMIIPETESRELESIGGLALIEISINGLIVANIASHFGLPDLFDTNTGLSAIGRLGLMDGQAIFAYNGLFPPEPSPWEKMYLGWLNPTEVRTGGQFQLIAKGLTQGSESPVIKIPINSSEYYLVELRHRDAKNDGAIITYISGGETHTKTFPKDTTGFYSYDTDSISGVVIDVDDYDWALPGNGILIWHIDENVIQENLAENKINANKFRRGVDVEEADGIQDIGEKFFTIFGDEVIGEGAQEDFWYRGNRSRLFKNRFDRNSFPPATSNAGANSLISITEFSPVGTSMSFNLILGDTIITPVFTNNFGELGTGEISLTVSDDGQSYLLNNTNLYFRSNDGNILIQDFSSFKPVVYSSNGEDLIIGVLNDQVNIVRSSGLSIDQKITASQRITAPPVISNGNLIIGLFDGSINYYSLENILNNPQLLKTERTGTIVPVRKLAVSGDYVAALKYFNPGEVPDNIPDEYQIADNSGKDVIYSRHGVEPPLSFALLKKTSGYDYVILETNNVFSVIRNNEPITFEIKTTNQITSFALGDLKLDQNPSIIFTDGNNLRAVNFAGAEVVDFPYSDTSRIGFIGTPLILDYNSDRVAEILTYTQDGRIFLINSDGTKIDGFPISVGAPLNTVPSLNIRPDAISITVFSGETLYSWNLNSQGSLALYWSEEFGNNKNESAAEVLDFPNAPLEFFPKSRAYNWPNPVYEDFTNIRYFVGEDSRVNIKIFDLAGSFVAELNHDGQGGLDNEVRWDVTDVQSGVYMARIEAAGVSGKNENTVIKIAVIK